MKITFSTIKSGEIFCDDFLCLTDLNGTIEFKHNANSRRNCCCICT